GLGTTSGVPKPATLRPPELPRIKIHKGGLNDFIRTAAATRGFKSDVNWDEYSAAPINIHRNLGTLRVHEGGELFELGGELAEAVRMNSFKPLLCISMRGSSGERKVAGSVHHLL
ncbi:hypothetical protein E4U25_005162, partial [Claviceps purpurea]